MNISNFVFIFLECFYEIILNGFLFIIYSLYFIFICICDLEFFFYGLIWYLLFIFIIIINLNLLVLMNILNIYIV